MSFEPDFIWYASSKGTDAMKADLFFAPDPQLAQAPSPESFDLEVDNDKEVEEFDLELSFKQFDDFFATFRDTIPVVPTPSVVTHSTDSLYGVTSSQYSCDPTSDYSIPSEIESRGSVNDGLYSTNASVYSDAFSNSPASIPPPSPAWALSDYGTLNLDPNSIAVQESATVGVSAAVHVVPDKAHGPDKRFKCPVVLCPFSSARKHNLKTHIETHYQSKGYECSTCRRRLTRKHDLRRHRETIHGEQMSSSSSVSSISKRRFDPMPDRPDRFYHCIALNGDPTPMSSTNPGSTLNFDPAIDLPENIIAWLQGV